MASAADNARPRRFAKACDSCFKRKVKCEGESIPCQQCNRRDETCTFTRAQVDINKPRRAGRQLKVVSDRLQHVETLLIEARQREQQALAREHRDSTEHGAIQISSAPLGVEQRDALLLSTQLEGDILAQPIPHEILVILELYGEQWGKFYPFISSLAIINSVIQPRTRTEAETTVLRICVRAMLSMAFRMANFSAANDRAFNADQEADRQLQMAIADSGPIIAALPSVTIIQTLLCIGMSMTHSSAYSLAQADIMLASAIRGAYFLGMDDLDSVIDLSDSERQRRRVLFQCLYIQDLNLSAALSKPPLCRQQDSRMDRRSAIAVQGIITSLDDEYQINIFGAHFRLSGIQHRVWSELRPLMDVEPEQAKTVQNDICAALFEWFQQYLPAASDMVEDRWPSTVYVHVVRLFLAHYRTLIWVYPQRFSDPYTLERWLKQQPTSIDERLMAMQSNDGPPVLLVVCTRAMFTAVRSIGKAGLPWLAETIREMLSGCLVLFHALIYHGRPDLIESDYNRAESWLSLIKGIHSQAMDAGELEVAIRVLEQLRPLAIRAMADLPAAP